MYSNKILTFQESTTILNARTKKSGNLLNKTRIYFITDVFCFSINWLFQFGDVSWDILQLFIYTFKTLFWLLSNLDSLTMVMESSDLSWFSKNEFYIFSVFLCEYWCVSGFSDDLVFNVFVSIRLRSSLSVCSSRFNYSQINLYLKVRQTSLSLKSISSAFCDHWFDLQWKRSR